MQYLGSFSSKEDICREFAISDFNGVVLYANYDNENYCGSAQVIFVNDVGEFFFVEGSHCSCYGLEDSWLPETISIKMMAHMVKEAQYGFWRGMFRFADALGQIERKGSPENAEGWLTALREYL